MRAILPLLLGAVGVAACSPKTGGASPASTGNILQGTWSIWSIDGRSLSESYEFRADGTMSYVVGGEPRRYSYRITNDRLTIDRGGGITLNRLLDSCREDELLLHDTDVGIRMLLKREGTNGPKGSTRSAESKSRLDEELCAAILEDAEMPAIDALITRGANVRHESRFGVPAVVQAARNDRCDVIERLHDQGADVEARDDGGMTPLAAAVEQAHLRSVACLVRRGADRTARDRYGRDLAQIAAATPYDVTQVLAALDDPAKAEDLVPGYTRQFK